MADINNVLLVGRLTKDAELKYTANGMAIGNFSIANGRNRKTPTGWEKETSFFDITVFGKQAENLQVYLKKGKQVAVSGWLKQERWQSQDGSNKSKLSVCADNVQLLGDRPEGIQQAQAYQPQQQMPQQVQQVQQVFNTDFQSDIPF